MDDGNRLGDPEAETAPAPPAKQDGPPPATTAAAAAPPADGTGQSGPQQPPPPHPATPAATHERQRDPESLLAQPLLGSGSAASLASSAAESVAPQGGGLWARFKRAVHRLKCEDPRVGFLPRMLALATIAYLLSPLDLLPDFIPVIGLVDDLIIVPALLALAVWLIPAPVMAEARARAEREPLRLHDNWTVACLFFLMWDALLLSLAWWALKRFGSPGLRHYRWWVVGGLALALAAAQLLWACLRYRREARRELRRTAAGIAGAPWRGSSAAAAGGAAAEAAEARQPLLAEDLEP